MGTYVRMSVTATAYWARKLVSVSRRRLNASPAKGLPSIRVGSASIEQDGQLLADGITAAGRYGSVVPEGLREDGQTLRGGTD